MVRLPKMVKDAIDKQDVFPIATCGQDGIPNLVYIKFLKVIDDETVLIADNRFSKTRKNIQDTQKLAFVVLDEEKGSFQIKGSTEWLTSGPMFDEVQEWVPDRLPRVAAVVLHVEQVYNGADQLA